MSRVQAKVRFVPSEGARRLNWTKKRNYNFGFRKMGDTLLQSRDDVMQWDSPHNVELLLKYTANGADVGLMHLLSYISIDLEVGTDDTSAEVINGGFGEDSIEILVTALNTRWFAYETHFFGTPQAPQPMLEKVEVAKV